MGVKNVNKIIGKYARYVPLKNYENQRIGIDARNWMYRFLRSPAYTHHQYPILKGFLNQINTFAKYNITPIYVFDGKASEEKVDTLQKRKDQKEKVINRIELLRQEIQRREQNDHPEEIEIDLDDLKDLIIDSEGNVDLEAMMDPKPPGRLRPIDEDEVAVRVEDGVEDGVEDEDSANEDFAEMTIEDMQNKVNSLKVQTFVPTRKDAEMCKQLFTHVSVKHISARGEADEVLALLYRRKDIDAVLSADMDMLAYGTTHLLADLKSAKGGGAVCKQYVLDDILSDMGWTLNQFVDFCILCGCDYIDRIPWLGCKTAKKYIDTHFTVENVVADIKRKKKSRIKLEDEDTPIYFEKVGKSRRIFNLSNLDESDLLINEFSANLIAENIKQNDIQEQNVGEYIEEKEDNEGMEEEMDETPQIHQIPKKSNSWMPDAFKAYTPDEKDEFFIAHDLPNYVPYVPPSVSIGLRKPKKPLKKKSKVDNNQSSITKFFT
jgi:5'-3' exonuclease